MAGIFRDNNGTRRIHFHAPDGKRKTIRLGKCSQKVAEAVKVKIEALVTAIAANQPADAETAKWVSGLDAAMANKLAAVGLTARREDGTLGGLLKVFDRRNDVKPATKIVWGQARRNLIEFFGEDAILRNITSGQAEDFHQHLVGLGLAYWTVHKRLQFCRMFFRTAIRRGLLFTNPFAEVQHKRGSTTERQFFVTRDVIAKIMRVCNLNWRVILGLSRFGGLRCPSEVLSLRWADVNWETNRFTVWSPKTEHHDGKDHRIVPIFPELRPILEEAYQEAKKENYLYVVNGTYRIAAMGPSGWKNANLRTQFQKLIKRAGLTSWPRLFHNMRASRETELVEQFPVQVVTAWLGNTPSIAMRHYLQVRDSDYEKAIKGDVSFIKTPVVSAPATYAREAQKWSPEGDTKSDTTATRNPTPYTAAQVRPRSPASAQPVSPYELVRPCMNPSGYIRTTQAEGTGLEPATPLQGHHISSVAANHSLTLRKSLPYNSLRYVLFVVKGLLPPVGKDGCTSSGGHALSTGLQTP